MEENTSLLTKLIQKIRKSKGKIVKCVVGLMIVVTLGVYALSACQNSNNINVDPDSEIDAVDEKSDTFDIFTPMLAGLLKDAEYREYGKNMYFMQPHPYTFLAQQGHDVARLKSGELSGKTISFIKDSEPNNLYMATYVEDESGVYTEYMLRYKLSNDEIDDYKLLYNLPGYQYYAIQICYINDQISKTKTPTVLSVGNMSKEAHDGWLKNTTTNTFKALIKNDKNNYFNFILRDFTISEELYSADKFRIYFIQLPTPSSNPNICESQMVEAEFRSKIDYSGNLLVGPTVSESIGYTKQQKQNFEENKQPISLFYINGGVHYLYTNIDKDFVNEYYNELKNN